MRVRIARVRGARDSDLPLPAPRHARGGGIDLHAAVKAAVIARPRERVLVPTGFAIAVPEGFEAQVRPRSGLALRTASSCPTPPVRSTPTTGAR